MKPYPTILLLIISLTSLFCNREDLQNNISEANAEIKSVTLKKFRNDTIVLSWTFFPDDQSYPGHLVINRIDSGYLYSSRIVKFQNIKRTIDYDLSTGKIKNIISKNFRSGWRGFGNGSGERGEIRYENSPLDNFKSSISVLYPGITSEVYRILVEGFMDTLQIINGGLDKRDMYVGTAPGLERYDLYKYDDWGLRVKVSSGLITNDTLLFEDQKEYSKFSYFYNQLPFYYVEAGIDRQQYFGKSLFQCDSFVLMNGDYHYRVVNNNYGTQIFEPILIRKTTYNFNSDSAALKKICTIINPSSLDYLWYFMGKSFVSTLEEDDGHYNALNWISARSVDSVFTITNNKQRNLRQIIVTNTTVKKDNQSRITQIINRTDNDIFMKQIDVEYK